MAENRICRFDFSDGESKVISAPKAESVDMVDDVIETPMVDAEAERQRVTNEKKTKANRSLEKREAIREGQKRQSEELKPRERRFCELYVEYGVGSRAVIEAGYNVANPDTASAYANELLKKQKIREKITQLQELCENNAIADAQEVMQFFTRVMRGEVKDQFGLEAPLSERAKAAQELAKRTVDIENRIKALQQGENAITIKLDWKPDDDIVQQVSNTAE